MAADGMVGSERSPLVAAGFLLVAPVLIVAGIAVWTISDRLLYIGPGRRARRPDGQPGARASDGAAFGRKIP